MNKPLPVVSLSFFTFPFKNHLWALKQMQLAKAIGEKLEGSTFAKLLGTGSGSLGFSIWPDFGTYALLCVWENAGKAKKLEANETFMELVARSQSNQTYYMACTQSHGAWGGINPLQASAEYVSGPMFTLTRASLAPSKIYAFWKHVPATNKALINSKGLLFSKGIGELPVIEQATFSYWQEAKDMVDFAYHSEHTQVLIKAKKEKWFKEELFARFIPINLDTW